MESLGPDFIIIGFPKCGTTSLVDNLSKHSKINMFYDVGNKESVYYHTSHYYKLGKDFYKDKLKPGMVNGEKNPTYIWNTFTLLNIKRRLPNVKVIISLRNPPDYLYSWYHQLYVNSKCGCEKCKKLAEDKKNGKAEENKVEEQVENKPIKKLNVKNKKKGKKFDVKLKNKHNKEITFEDFIKFPRQIENSYFVNHIIKAQDIFGKENTHILVQEEYEEDSQKELNKIFKFLGVEEENLKDIVKFKGKRPKGNIDPKIRVSLVKKYHTHNEQLFKILGNKIEAWVS
jgi:hypothetical protein